MCSLGLSAKAELLEYAHSQTDEERLLAPLRRLPDREYGFLDEVGEELVGVQPTADREQRREPRPESGDVPGGEAYVRRG